MESNGITLTDDNIHSVVFECFVSMKPEVIYQMKTCDHSLNIHLLNPYHMEGDVWTHTCLVYNSLKLLKEFNDLDLKQKLLVCIIAICHDLGKPFTRHINENNYVTFYGHEKRSVIETITILDFLIKTFKINAHDVYFILLIISLHSEYWKEDCNLDNIYSSLNYDDWLLSIYKVLTKADSIGQITSNSLNGTKKDIFSLSFTVPEILPEFDKHKQVVSLMIGCPASGKDTIANALIYKSTESSRIVSYDDIRVDLYKEAFPNIDIDINTLSSNELYQNAWKWCNEKRINLDEIMYTQIREILASGRNVIISNTNVTKKARKSHIERLRKEFGDSINIGAIFVCVDRFDLCDRDEQRKDKDKSVGEKVITRMYNNFELPELNEGFDRVEIFLNPLN